MFLRHCVAFSCFLIVSRFSSALLANGTLVDVEAALKSAGDNRAQLESALAKVPADQAEGMRFLIANMPERDLRSLSAAYLLTNVELAYRARNDAPWKHLVSNELFLDYVLPYAVVDEPRDNWRKDLSDHCKLLVKGIDEPAKVAVALNQKFFPLVKVRFAANRKRANQSPLETIEAGKASCTGLSILLVDACRAVGVPARLVGIPQWTDNSGNHSWVEIWDGKEWRYTGAAEPTGNELNSGWFVGRAASALRDEPMHAIYAARFARSPLVFPSAWSRRQGTVYAVNVTDRYTKDRKPPAVADIIVRFRVLDKPNGSRVSARLKITTADGKTVFEGDSRDDRFDPNDHVEVVVQRDKPLHISISALDREMTADLQPTRSQELFTYYLSESQTKTPAWQKLSTAEQAFADSPTGQQLSQLLTRYFSIACGDRAAIQFDTALDPLVHNESSAVRKLAWIAYLDGHEAQELNVERLSNVVRFEKFESPFVVRTVGRMPENGWPLVIAMHGGGGAPAEVNDSQWKVMQHYYHDQPSVEGYLYLAIRAPNNTWNGFYSPYNLGLTDCLVRQHTACSSVDPNKVYLIGYSHGGYGAFYVGARMPDRFAAIHASAAAPSEGNVTGKNLRNTQFSFMIGEHDLAHNRLLICREFDKYVSSLRENRDDIYPVRMELIKDFKHSGLPDRDKIKDLYPAVRNPLPRELSWALSDQEVDSFNWLHVPDPAAGMEIDARCRDNRLSIKSQRIQEIQVLLDERLVDFEKPVVIDLNGEISTQSVLPSLRTLCETLAERGDPEFMFASRLTVYPRKNEP